MAAPKGKKRTTDSTQEKKYTFTFTVPEIIGLCAGSVAALCAFFVLGILLGRGYQPEKDMPKLEMMMPSSSANSSGEVKGGVLKPEELQYIDAIKKKPESALKPEPKKKEVAAKPEIKKSPAPAKKEAEQAKATKPIEPTFSVEIDNPEEPAAPVYNYIYQVASFGSNGKAQDFNSKLIERGLNSYVEPGKSGTRIWYRVFIRHTGTAASTDSMRNILRKFGIKKPLLKSKKSVE
ncbi:SPOR domain-containing protein [Maridesulfovibrio zosterae]|uniref:SPOR domain-containing protein n=1 Tax=Maridesulfovibrio zosterae TaxID=82171 RepID=UPI000412462C|nr:SPOR domain-containing protein [Maridesulfovibrio zosterae]